MKRDDLTLASSNPKPERGTPEHLEWVREKLRRSVEENFGPNAPKMDPELEQGFLCGSYDFLTISDAVRDKEDEEIEAEQRAFARRHLKPV